MLRTSKDDINMKLRISEDDINTKSDIRAVVKYSLEFVSVPAVRNVVCCWKKINQIQSTIQTSPIAHNSVTKKVLHVATVKM